MPRILCRGGQGCLGSITRWTLYQATQWSRHGAGTGNAVFGRWAELRPRCCQLQAFGWPRPYQSNACDGDCASLEKIGVYALKP